MISGWLKASSSPGVTRLFLACKTAKPSAGHKQGPLLTAEDGPGEKHHNKFEPEMLDVRMEGLFLSCCSDDVCLELCYEVIISFRKNKYEYFFQIIRTELWF